MSFPLRGETRRTVTKFSTGMFAAVVDNERGAVLLKSRFAADKPDWTQPC